ncbi:hypothetical protein A2U01_0011515 [Trifolium medium]|uniref:Uncharacterized protein n=1 Tax=Trifolium medium TaxID=97028 RepID=A0A392MV84_9FABA|nr:hypothetical protein [Trifolium medium]
MGGSAEVPQREVVRRCDVVGRGEGGEASEEVGR